MGGLHICTNEDDLKTYLSHFGEVVNVAFKYDAVTKLSKGYAFIEFTTSDMVELVLQTQPHKIHGQ